MVPLFIFISIGIFKGAVFLIELTSWFSFSFNVIKKFHCFIEKFLKLFKGMIL